MWKFAYFGNIDLSEFVSSGQKKSSLKHCYLHGIVTCPSVLGLALGVRFLRRFSFRCGFGSIFVVVLSSLASEHFCCDLAQVKA